MRSTDAKVFRVVIFVIALLYLVLTFFMESSTFFMNRQPFPYSIATIFCLTFFFLILFYHSLYKEAFLGLAVCILLGFVTDYIELQAKPGDSELGLSRAVFDGKSNSEPNLIWLIYQAIFLTIFASMILISKRNLPNANKRRKTINDTKTIDWDLKENWKCVSGLTFIWALLLNPISYSSIEVLLNPRIGVGLDSGQFWTWQVFRSKGYLPMKDFWYPYSGFIQVQDGILGKILAWFMLVYSSFVITKLVFILTKSLITTSITMLPIIYYFANYWSTVARYGFPLLALLYFVLRIGNFKKSLFSILLLVLPVCISIWFSPEVAVIIIAFFFSSLVSMALTSYASSYSIVISGTAMTVSIIAQLIYLNSTNQLAALLQLLSNPRELIQYSYSPVEVSSSNFVFGESKNLLLNINMIILITFIYTTFSLVKRNRINLLINIESTIALFIICQYIVWLYQKELVRGWMAQPITYAIFALILIWNLVLKSQLGINKSNKKHETFNKVSVILGVVLILSSLTLDNNASRLLSKPFSVLSETRSIIKEYNPNTLWKVFYTSNFNQVISEDQIGDEIMKTHSNIDFDDVYILGDIPSIYVRNPDKPYWTISIWNSSPNSIQNKLLGQISDRRPKYIVVDLRAQTLNFDGTPSVLRIPKIYKYLVNNYQIIEIEDNYAIALRDSKNSSSPFEWSQLFGKNINIGRIPMAVQAPTPCVGGSNCISFLEFKSNQNQFIFTCDNIEFAVDHSLTPSNSAFYFPLERFWFWNSNCVLSKDSLNAKVVLGKFDLHNQLY